LVSKGHMIGIHFDPLIYQVDFELQYQAIIEELKEVLPDKYLGYISIGVVRFTKDVHREVEKNYPQTKMLAQDFTKSFDGKMRYNKPMRMWMMQKVKSYLVSAGYTEAKIYFCMEEN
jgi:spore photoproduct lyase